ncbi:MAG: DUF1540 domain-containing protein [Pseudomonadota bacterium]
MMPKVESCTVNSCFYWRDGRCCAEAINVGADHPNCDTFKAGSGHIDRCGLGGVGACKVENCRHNNQLLCNAPKVSVGMHYEHADCETFVPR